MNTTAINGVVVDQFSRPVEGAVITIMEGTGQAPDIAAIANENGEFSFFGVEPGQYRLKAISGQTAAYAEVSTPQKDSVRVIRLILPEGK